MTATVSAIIAAMKLPKMFGSTIVPYAPKGFVRCSTALALTSAPPTEKPAIARRNATMPMQLAMSAPHRQRAKNSASSSRVSRKLMRTR